MYERTNTPGEITKIDSSSNNGSLSFKEYFSMTSSQQLRKPTVVYNLRTDLSVKLKKALSLLDSTWRRPGT
jgi:hypothetical protein